MNNIAIANETIRITAQGFYEVGGEKVTLPDYDFTASVNYPPEKGAELLSNLVIPDEEICRITVTGEDSFSAAERFENPFVMNFANAHNAGGGFRLGANAQEEALCRCSTLYASISTDSSKKMYRYNNTHFSPTDSDYMLYSPNVCVFRNHGCEKQRTNFMVSVVTVPAPNRHGAAVLVSKKNIINVIQNRIRIMFAVAAEHGHRNLILGAWGCGAFGNHPNDVAEAFRKVLVDEGFGKLFDNVCFAVYSGRKNRNLIAFKDVLEK